MRILRRAWRLHESLRLCLCLCLCLQLCLRQPEGRELDEHFLAGPVFGFPVAVPQTLQGQHAVGVQMDPDIAVDPRPPAAVRQAALGDPFPGRGQVAPQDERVLLVPDADGGRPAQVVDDAHVDLLDVVAPAGAVNLRPRDVLVPQGMHVASARRQEPEMKVAPSLRSQVMVDVNRHAGHLRGVPNEVELGHGDRNGEAAESQ